MQELTHFAFLAFILLLIMLHTSYAHIILVCTRHTVTNSQQLVPTVSVCVTYGFRAQLRSRD